MSSPALARHQADPIQPVPPMDGTANAPRAAAAAPTPQPSSFGTIAARWYRLNKDKLRAALLGAISLVLFLVAWHLLTAYRVVFFVRFTNVPAPLAVYASFTKAIHDPKFLMHIALSCRRILLGFSLAALVGVPLGLLMGRFKALHEFVFPVAEVLRPIPAIAWVPMAIMLWPSNEQSIVFITFLGSFFPILVNTLHGMSLVDPVLVRAARCLGARETAIFREVYFPASLPHIFTGLTIGMGVAWVSLIAAEMISGQYGIGYFTWEAYSLVQYSDIALGMITIGVLGLASSALIRATGRLAMPWGRA
jgi:NitT/TauT family transport system permease protein